LGVWNGEGLYHVRKIKRIIPITPDHSVILCESTDFEKCSFIAIKQSEKVNNMPGIVLISPNPNERPH